MGLHNKMDQWAVKCVVPPCAFGVSVVPPYAFGVSVNYAHVRTVVHVDSMIDHAQEFRGLGCDGQGVIYHIIMPHDGCRATAGRYFFRMPNANPTSYIFPSSEFTAHVICI